MFGALAFLVGSAANTASADCVERLHGTCTGCFSTSGSKIRTWYLLQYVKCVAVVSGRFRFFMLQFMGFESYKGHGDMGT